MKIIKIEDALKQKNVVFVDVRTSNEFTDGTIYGAINIPIFDNEERELIGYTYKQIGKQQAKEIGLEIASKKLMNIYNELKKIHDSNNKIVIFCARGGMRSGSIVKVMEMMHINICQLEGGYKDYRKYVLNKFDEWNLDRKFLVLRGGTGVGKTDLLNRLEQEGYNTLDLEKMANHRGSVFGNIGLGKQTSQKTFEAEIFHKVYNMNDKFIFIEAESSKIGNRVVPKFANNGIVSGVPIKITCDINVRALRLINEYKDCDDEQFIVDMLNSLKRIKSYMDNENYNNIKQAIEMKEYKEAAIILLEKYYDPLYIKWEKKYENNSYTQDTTNFEEVIINLIKIYEEQCAL